MDPDTTLAEISATAALLCGPCDAATGAAQLDELRRLVQSLGDWLDNGGFYPANWTN